MRLVTTPRGAPPGRAAAAARVTVAAAACVVLCLVAGPTGLATAARDVATVVALGGAALVLRRRAAGAAAAADGERDVWLRLSHALLAVAVGAAAQGLLASGAVPLDGTSALRAAVAASAFDVGVLVACPLVYQALIRWNRYRSLTADPGDWLNGLSSVLAIVGVANLVLAWTGAAALHRPWWEIQGGLLAMSAPVMLLGTTATIAGLGGLQRDRRVWGVGGAIAAVTAGAVLRVVQGTGADAQAWPVAAWAAAAAVLAWCTVPPPTRTEPRTATAEAPTIGALVVLVASVVLLILNSERLAAGGDTGASRWADYAPTLCAVLAVLGVSVRVVHLIRDLALLARTRQEARTDELTGVANRRALMARLDEAVADGGPVALLVLDLDRFKEVNDRHGHAAGDALLRAAAERFAAIVPAGGLLARLGGDEFAVVLATDEAGAVRVASALAGAVGYVEIEGHPLHTVASVGVAVGVPGADAGELLRRADAAMYQAKGSGRGVGRYDEDIDRLAAERAVLVEQLRAGLDPVSAPGLPQFVVHYQPQVDLGTGRAAGVEALVRWRHPDRGLLLPGVFIGLVEQYGLMWDLTEHVLRAAATQAALWQAAGRPLRVSVNLSASSLTHPGLLPLLDGVLATTGADPALLVLEVTETTLMADADEGLRTARAIAERGIGVSIDDYGTGYSSLTYLNDLPAVELKLDRSFVVRMAADERTRSIVAATVDLAHRLGLRLVAEGVEDADTLRLLRGLGCDESQGFWHCRPQPVEDLEEWLASMEPASVEGVVLGGDEVRRRGVPPQRGSLEDRPVLPRVVHASPSHHRR